MIENRLTCLNTNYQKKKKREGKIIYIHIREQYKSTERLRLYKQEMEK